MLDEVMPHDDALIHEPESIIAADDDTKKVLRLSKHEEGIDLKGILAAAVQMFNAADIVGKIQKGAEFVVQVPAQYQAGLRAGAFEMMRGAKSGKTWATLVRKLANGKQEIVCNCPITEQTRIIGNPIQNLSGVYQNLFMQQKLADLSKQVQEVYDVVLSIEQGQMDDRIGKLISGRDDVQRALENHNSEDRKRELELARSKISEAQSQIGQVFKSRVEKFEPIPESKLARRLREILTLTTSYMKKRDEEFGKLQDYFEFYLRATQLLAWSYSVAGDTERAKIVFEQSISFLRTIDFRNVRTLDYIYPQKSMDDAFYHQAIPYLQAEETVCLEEARPYEFVQITLSSEELEEALEYVKAV
ncbi:MAG: hypothetical protein II875_04150 [Clostridia bacterium]|nr:hypothetical protein [Clostridia bacterium]